MSKKTKYLFYIFSLSIFTFINQNFLVKAKNPDIPPEVVLNTDTPDMAWDIALKFGNILLWIVIAMCFIFIVFAGYQLVTSEGEVHKVEKAKKTIFGAGIGFGITLFALLIVNLFAEFIGL